MFELIQEYAGWIVGVSAGLSALGWMVRKAYQKVVAIARKLDNVADTLLGREEIRHPDTGRVLTPATPGLGVRLAHIEEALERLVETDARLSRLETKVEDHIVKALEMEKARAEEAKEMWKAIRAIASTTPDWGGAT